MATTPAPVPEAQASLSPLARIVDVFFSPKRAFEDIVKKPSWIAPLVLLFLTGLSLNLIIVNRVNWVEASKEQISKSKFASSRIDQLDDARKEEAYRRAATQAKIGRYVRGVIGWPLALLFSSLLYFGGYKLIAGARTTYGTTFTILAFASLPMALREVLGSVVTAVKDASAIEPENYLASNPAAFLGPDIPTWQMVPLAALDVFALWAMILVAIGFSAADPKKLPFGRSIGIAVGVNISIILFFTMIAWIFS